MFPMSGSHSALIWPLLKCCYPSLFFLPGEFVAILPVFGLFWLLEWRSGGIFYWLPLLTVKQCWEFIGRHIVYTCTSLYSCTRLVWLFFHMFVMCKLLGCTLSPAWLGGFTPHLIFIIYLHWQKFPLQTFTPTKAKTNHGNAILKADFSSSSQIYTGIKVCL